MENIESWRLAVADQAADEDTLASLWHWSIPERVSSLEENAKFGLAVLREMCAYAHHEKLVIVLGF